MLPASRRALVHAEKRGDGLAAASFLEQADSLDDQSSVLQITS